MIAQRIDAGWKQIGAASAMRLVHKSQPVTRERMYRNQYYAQFLAAHCCRDRRTWCHLQLCLRKSARACSLCEVCDGASRVGRAHAHPRAEPAAIRSVRRGSVRQRIDRASLALRRIALLNGTHAFHACNCHGFVCVLCCRQARARHRRHEHRTVARRGALMLPDDAGDALVFPAVAVYANVYKACMGSAAAVRSCLLLVRLLRRTCCTSSRASCRLSRRYRSANAA